MGIVDASRDLRYPTAPVTAVACPFCGAEHTAGTYVCPVTNRRLQGLLPVNTVVDGKYRMELNGGGEITIAFEPAHPMYGLGFWFELRNDAAAAME